MDHKIEGTTEAERFRDFAKKVISVPKAVIDRREKEWKARKALKKARA